MVTKAKDFFMSFGQLTGHTFGQLFDILQWGKQIPWGQMSPRDGYTRWENFQIDFFNLDPREDFMRDTAVGQAMQLSMQCDPNKRFEPMRETHPLLYSLNTPRGYHYIPENARAKGMTVNFLAEQMDLFNLFDPDVIKGGMWLAASLRTKTGRAFTRALANLPLTVRSMEPGGSRTIGQRLFEASQRQILSGEDALPIFSNPYARDIYEEVIYDQYLTDAVGDRARQAIPGSNKGKIARPSRMRYWGEDPSRYDSERYFQWCTAPLNDQHAEEIYDLYVEFFGPLGELAFKPPFRKSRGLTARNVAGLPASPERVRLADVSGEAISTYQTNLPYVHQYIADEEIYGAIPTAYAYAKASGDKRTEVLRKRILDNGGEEALVAADAIKGSPKGIPTETMYNDALSEKTLAALGSAEAYKSDILRRIQTNDRVDELPWIPKQNKWRHYGQETYTPEEIVEIDLGKEFWRAAVESGAIFDGNWSSLEKLARSRPEWRDMLFNPFDGDATHLLGYVSRADKKFRVRLEALKKRHIRTGDAYKTQTIGDYPLLSYPGGFSLGPEARWNNTTQKMEVPLFDDATQIELSRTGRIMTATPAAMYKEMGDGAYNFGMDRAYAALNKITLPAYLPEGQQYDTARNAIYDMNKTADQLQRSMLEDIRMRRGNLTKEEEKYYKALLGQIADAYLADGVTQQSVKDLSSRVVDNMNWRHNQKKWNTQDPYTNYFTGAEKELMEIIRANPELSDMPSFSSLLDVILSEGAAGRGNVKVKKLPSEAVGRVLSDLQRHAASQPKWLDEVVDSGAIYMPVSPPLADETEPFWYFHVPAMTPQTAEIMNNNIRDLCSHVMSNQDMIEGAANSYHKSLVEDWRRAPIFIRDKALENYLVKFDDPVRMTRPMDMQLTATGNHKLLDKLSNSRLDHNVAASQHHVIRLDPPPGGWTPTAIVEAHERQVRAIVKANDPGIFADGLLQIRIPHSAGANSWLADVDDFIKDQLPLYEMTYGPDPVIEGTMLNARNYLEKLTKSDPNLLNLDEFSLRELQRDFEQIAYRMNMTIHANRDLDAVNLALIGLKDPDLDMISEAITGGVEHWMSKTNSFIDGVQGAIEDILTQHLSTGRTVGRWKYVVNDADAAQGFGFIQSLTDFTMAGTREFGMIEDLKKNLNAAHEILKVANTGENVALSPTQIASLNALRGDIVRQRDSIQQALYRETLRAKTALMRAAEDANLDIGDVIPGLRLPADRYMADPVLLAIIRRYATGEKDDILEGTRKLQDLHIGGHIDEATEKTLTDLLNDVETINKINPSQLVLDMYRMRVRDMEMDVAEVLALSRHTIYGDRWASIITKMEDPDYAQAVIEMMMRDKTWRDIPDTIKQLSILTQLDVKDIAKGIMTNRLADPPFEVLAEMYRLIGYRVANSLARKGTPR